MSALWVPPTYTKQAGEASAAQEADIAAMAAAAQEMGDAMRYWEPLLQQIDPHLRLVKAFGNAESPGLRPGFWHVIRHNPGAPPTIIVLENEDGSYQEPSQRMLDLVRHNDLQNVQVDRDRRERARRDREASEKRRADANRERSEELAERVKAVTRAQVSMTERDKGWTQNARGRRQK